MCGISNDGQSATSYGLDRMVIKVNGRHLFAAGIDRSMESENNNRIHALLQEMPEEMEVGVSKAHRVREV
jgi:hypothetical protein